MHHCAMITFVILAATTFIFKYASNSNECRDEQVTTSLLPPDTIKQRDHLSQQLNRLQVKIRKKCTLLLICDAEQCHDVRTMQNKCVGLLHVCTARMYSWDSRTFTAEAENSPLCDRHSGSTEYGKPTLDLQAALSASSKQTLAAPLVTYKYAVICKSPTKSSDDTLLMT